MSLNFQFAVISDLHIALPHTLQHHPKRLHLSEVSIPVLEVILERLSQLELDFLLLPGDLTQDGEPDNHTWLVQRLAQLPYPIYVVPGNHDVLKSEAEEGCIGLIDFPHYYRPFGYNNPQQLYYTHPLLPGVRLIGLNSNQFNAEGKQIGRLDAEQMVWLRQVLTESQEEMILVMIHHNVVEHLPGQSQHSLGRRYMLENASELRSLLSEFGVQLLFTGHLHIQDIAEDQGIYEITTGSLVTFPHPYRILQFHTDSTGTHWLQVESDRVTAVPGWADLSQDSRDLIAERSEPFMLQLLMQPPLKLPLEEAQTLVSSLRYFWAEIANGDALFDFAHFPPDARRYFESFGALNSHGNPHLIDNSVALKLEKRNSFNSYRTIAMR